MNSRLTTHTRGPSRGKQKCRLPGPVESYLRTPAMKATTAWGTCSKQLALRRKEQPRLLQRKEPINETQVDRYVTRNWFTGGRTAGVGTSRFFVGVRYQQTPDAEGNVHKVGNDQSSLLVPYRREKPGWYNHRMADRRRQPEYVDSPGCHQVHRQGRNGVDD